MTAALQKRPELADVDNNLFFWRGMRRLYGSPAPPAGQKPLTPGPGQTMTEMPVFRHFPAISRRIGRVRRLTRQPPLTIRPAEFQ